MKKVAFYALLGFFLVILLLIQQTFGTRVNYQLEAAKNELTSLREELTKVRLKLEIKQNLTDVKRIAEKKLKMEFPIKIEYIYEK